MNGGSEHLRKKSVQPGAGAEQLTGTSLSTPTHSYNLRSTPVRYVLETSESQEERYNYCPKSLLQVYIEERGIVVPQENHALQPLDKKPIRARTLFNKKK